MTALLRNRDARTIWLATAAFLAFKAVSALTGLGERVDAVPAATVADAAFAILPFAALGVSARLSPSPEKGLRPLLQRLNGTLFLVIATIPAIIPYGDPINPVSE